MAISAIPWWGKIGAKIILSRLPVGYGFWQRLGLFRHGDMDQSDYALDVFESHLSRADMKGCLPGKTVLELGPGDSLATAVIVAAHGGRAVLVDTGAYARKDVSAYRGLAQKLRQSGLPAPDIDACADVGEMLKLCGASYLSEGLASLRQLPDDSVDFIFSHAVLEHIRKHDFAASMAECRRVLKQDGVFSNQVDLKDHLSAALNNLRFSERTWESPLFVRSGFYTNRIRYSAMLAAFAEAGFRTEKLEAQYWPSLPTARRDLAPEFRDLPDDELRVASFYVLLRDAAHPRAG